jgi:hypothetical protein
LAARYPESKVVWIDSSGWGVRSARLKLGTAAFGGILFCLAAAPVRADVTIRPVSKLSGSVATNSLIQRLAGGLTPRIYVKDGRIAMQERESTSLFDIATNQLIVIRHDSQTFRPVDFADIVTASVNAIGTIQRPQLKIRDVTEVYSMPDKVGAFEAQRHTMRVSMSPLDDHSPDSGRGMEMGLAVSVWTAREIPAAAELRPFEVVMQALLTRPLLAIVFAMAGPEAAEAFEPIWKQEGTPVRLQLSISARIVGEGRPVDLGQVLDMTTDCTSISTAAVSESLLEIPKGYRKAPVELLPPRPQ